GRRVVRGGHAWHRRGRRPPRRAAAVPHGPARAARGRRLRARRVGRRAGEAGRGGPMSRRSRFSLASAFAAAERDELPLWVGDFLADRGSDNPVLAAALAQERHWWLGPIRVPVEDIVRLAGPEDDAVCPIEPEEWEDDVEQMEESI